MEILTKKQADDECGPVNAITPTQIMNMLKLANLSSGDVFYDLGSGYGRVVRFAVTKWRVKKAIGIEYDGDRFCVARTIAKRELTRNQLKKIDFLCIDIVKSDFSDATVIYDGHEEDKEEIKIYNKVLKNRRVKIVKMDLPLISYKPIAVNRDSPNCWFFLMQYPLQKYKIWNKDEWASYVLSRKNVTMEDVYSYYERQLQRREIIASDRRTALRTLKRFVRQRFR